MNYNKIYGIILTAVGAVDTYAAFTKMTSKGAKFVQNIGGKTDILLIALLVSGIGFLALGLMKLFVEKK